MEKLTRIHRSTFVRQNAVLFTGTLLVSILNYLYYPILGRLLNLQDFGEVQVLVSFFLQLMMLLMVLTQVTTNIVANHDDAAERQAVIFDLEKLALWVSFGLFVLGSLLSWWLMQVLQFQSPWPFVLLLAAFVVTVPFTFRSGYLRGKQKFFDVSLGSLVGSASKIVASAGLVLAGFGTIGAIGGLIMAQILALLYTIHRAQYWGFRAADRNWWRWPDMQLIAPELKYFGLVLAGSLAITVMYSVDVILVKYFFSPQEAGLYAAVATIARILFFLTVSISQVLMPAVKLPRPVPRQPLGTAKHLQPESFPDAGAQDKARREAVLQGQVAAEVQAKQRQRNSRLLYKSTLLVSAIGATALGVIALFPELIMQVLMGAKYLAYADLLPRLSLAIFLISLLNLFVIYHLALRRYGVGVITVTGAVLTCGLIMVGHDSLQQVVNSVLLSSVITIGLLGAWIIARSMREGRRA